MKLDMTEEEIVAEFERVESLASDRLVIRNVRSLLSDAEDALSDEINRPDIAYRRARLAIIRLQRAGFFERETLRSNRERLK